MFKMHKKLIIGIVIGIVVVLFLAYNVFRYPTLFRSLHDESLNKKQVDMLVEKIKQKDDVHSLVAYFSYSGKTETIAKEIQTKVKGDLFEIERKEAYKNPYTQGNMEIRFNQKPELKKQVQNIKDYDVIFIGFPIWFHATPAIINSFIEEHDLKDKIIIPFCTSGGSDIDEAMSTFLNSCKDLAIYQEKRIANGDVVESWLQEIGLFK